MPADAGGRDHRLAQVVDARHDAGVERIERRRVEPGRVAAEADHAQRGGREQLQVGGVLDAALGAGRDVEGAIDLAAAAQRRIQAEPRLELLAPASLGVVCFRRRLRGVQDESALDAVNERILNRVNEMGEAMISSTRVRGRYALRLCIMNWRTTADDVAQILDAILVAAAGE